MQEMMSAIQDAQDELSSIHVTGSSGGGAVRVVASCAPEILSVEITDEALEDRELLGDLIVAAVNDALRNVQQAAGERLGGLAGPMMPPGFELPS